MFPSLYVKMKGQRGGGTKYFFQIPNFFRQITSDEYLNLVKYKNGNYLNFMLKNIFTDELLEWNYCDQVTTI